MRRLLYIAAILFFLVGTSTASANDTWAYAGRFSLPMRPAIAHNVDMYLINHLSTWQGSKPYGGDKSYLPYDVYYMHDHSLDTGDYHLEYANQSFAFQVKIVPLNIKFATMGKGYWGGTIICDYVVSAKGVYGVTMKSFRVFDTITHEKLFEATGNMGSEQLYTDSAAEVVLKISGDHPVDGGESSKLSGVGYYPYR